jgi:hypothetical protein
MSPLIAKPCQSERRLAPRMPSAYYSLHALLQTLRQFADNEDHICMLLMEMESTGKMSAKVSREVQKLLGELPLFSLESELESLAESLTPMAA